MAIEGEPEILGPIDIMDHHHHQNGIRAAPSEVPNDPGLVELDIFVFSLIYFKLHITDPEKNGLITIQMMLIENETLNHGRIMTILWLRTHNLSNPTLEFHHVDSLPCQSFQTDLV